MDIYRIKHLQMKMQIPTLLFALTLSNYAFSDLKYTPISIQLKTEKESYYEGEKVTFFVVLTNNDKENSHPILVPHTQNTGRKLFTLDLYDRAKKTRFIRASENPMLQMLVHDTGSVKIQYLKPLEELSIPIYWNDFENFYNYHTQYNSHHSFGVPIFAGLYDMRVTYNPGGNALGDSIYSFYNHTEMELDNSKMPMPSNGLTSDFCALKIRKSAESVLSIERVKYVTQWDKERNWCWYYKDSIGAGGSAINLVHITSLPIDSFTVQKGEYFYSHFTDIYAEYVKRFDNGEIQEYRKYRDECPEELYALRFNDFQQQTYFATKLPDHRFYTVSYNQPTGTKHQEIYYSQDGTLGVVIDYIYNKNGVFIKTTTTQTQPCIYIDEHKKSYRLMEEL